MNILKIILALFLTISSALAEMSKVPAEEGVVMIETKNMSTVVGNPSDGPLRENSNGYLVFTVETVNSKNWGADFMGLQSGVSIGINGVSEEMRKEIFGLEGLDDKKTFLFNKSQYSSQPSRITQATLHNGYIPITGIQSFKFSPWIYSAQTPDSASHSAYSHIINSATKVGSLTGTSEINAGIKVASIASQTIVDIFRLNDDRFYLKNPTPEFRIAGANETLVGGTPLTTGGILIYSSKFADYFNSKSVRARHSLGDHWRIQEGGWSFNSSRELRLNGTPLVNCEGAYMIIRVDWTDTVFRSGTVNLRLANPPSYWGSQSTYAAALQNYNEARQALQVAAYTPGNVINALSNANRAYVSMTFNIDNIKHLSPNDKNAINILIRDDVRNRVLAFLKSSHVEEFLAVEALRQDWLVLMSSPLVSEAASTLQTPESLETKGAWITRANEILRR